MWYDQAKRTSDANPGGDIASGCGGSCCGSNSGCGPADVPAKHALSRGAEKGLKEAVPRERQAD
mgnify:FL=1